jgi:hypothetical protein
MKIKIKHPDGACKISGKEYTTGEMFEADEWTAKDLLNRFPELYEKADKKVGE